MILWCRQRPPCGGHCRVYGCGLTDATVVPGVLRVASKVAAMIRAASSTSSLPAALSSAAA
jgi:hypothetical protein